MPEISRFFGIVIRMYFDDHNPRHIDATYGGSEAQIGTEPISILDGALPNRAASMVFEWAALHQRELDAELAASSQCSAGRKNQASGIAQCFRESSKSGTWAAIGLN